jgi:recombination protein RecA
MSKDKTIRQAIAFLQRSESEDLFQPLEVNRWATGWHDLDQLLGGGWVIGSVNEIFGKPESGKTTFILQIASIFLKQFKKKQILIIDMERTMDPKWADTLGLSFTHKRVNYCRPNNLEQAAKIMNILISTGEIGLLIVDSVHALIPKAEQDTADLKQNVALQARELGQQVRKLIGLTDDNKCIAIFLNHLSQEIGVYAGITSPGGRHLKHYSTHRLAFFRKKPLYSDDPNAARFKISLKRSKYDAQQRGEIEYELIPSVGICPQLEAIPKAKEKGLLVTAGSWFTLTIKDQEHKFQGKESLIQFIMENPGVVDEIYNSK